MEEDDALCVTCFCFLSDEPSLKKWKFLNNNVNSIYNLDEKV